MISNCHLLRASIQPIIVRAVLITIVFLTTFSSCSPNSDSVAQTTVSELSTPTRVEGAWARTGSAGTTTGAYATIYNLTDKQLKIVKVSSDVAQSVDIHETVEHDGMVHMEHQTDLTIPARDSLVLAPGGKHFMINSLLRDIIVGESITLVLSLDDGSDLEVVADVKPITGN